MTPLPAAGFPFAPGGADAKLLANVARLRLMRDIAQHAWRIVQDTSEPAARRNAAQREFFARARRPDYWTLEADIVSTQAVTREGALAKALLATGALDGHAAGGMHALAFSALADLLALEGVGTGSNLRDPEHLLRLAQHERETGDGRDRA